MKKRINYKEEDGLVISERFILEGEFIYGIIDGLSFKIKHGDDIIYTSDCVSLEKCKRKLRSKLLELGVIIDKEIRKRL